MPTMKSAASSGPALRPIRLLIATGQPLLRTGFRTVLGAEADLSVAGEAGTGTEALARTRRLLPTSSCLSRGCPVRTARL